MITIKEYQKILKANIDQLPREEYIDYIYDPKKMTLTIEIELGGRSGGNCYGGYAEHYTGYTGVYNIDFIYDIFGEINEDMSFFFVRNLIKQNKVEKTKEDREYYGNYTEYHEIIVDFKKILDALIEKGYVVDKVTK